MSQRKIKRWTIKEERVIIDGYLHKSAKELAGELDRSLKSVQGRIEWMQQRGRLGWKNRQFTINEIREIKAKAEAGESFRDLGKPFGLSPKEMRLVVERALGAVAPPPEPKPPPVRSPFKRFS